MTGQKAKSPEAQSPGSLDRSRQNNEKQADCTVLPRYQSRPPIARAGTKAPARASLPEIMHLTGRRVREIRADLSALRLGELRHEDDDRIVNLGEAAYLLARDRARVRELIRGGTLPGRQGIDGDFLVWKIRLGDVRALAQSLYGNGKENEE